MPRLFARRLFISALLLPLLAGAAQDPDSAQALGQFSYSAESVNPKIAAREKPLLLAKAKALIDLIAGSSVLRERRGFALNTSARIGFFSESVETAGDPFPVSGNLLLRNIDLRSNAKADAEGRYPGWGEGPALQFSFNNLLTLYGNNASSGHRRGAALQLPAASLRRAADGSYRFTQGGRSYIVIAAADREPFVQVTREQYLRDLMQELYPDGQDPGAKPGKGLAKLKAELEALSAEQRNSPACTGGRGRDWLSACTDPSSSYVVKPNLDYFDRRKPRHSVQLITLVVPEPWVGEDRSEGERLRGAAAELDLASLRALLG